MTVLRRALAFFYDEYPPDPDGPALNAAIVLRDERVRSMVARMSSLSPRSQDSLSDITCG